MRDSWSVPTGQTTIAIVIFFQGHRQTDFKWCRVNRILVQLCKFQWAIWASGVNGIGRLWTHYRHSVLLSMPKHTPQWHHRFKINNITFDYVPFSSSRFQFHSNRNIPVDFDRSPVGTYWHRAESNEMLISQIGFNHESFRCREYFHLFSLSGIKTSITWKSHSHSKNWLIFFFSFFFRRKK